MAAKKKTVRIALLDANLTLIGSTEVVEGSPEHVAGIDPGDLPLNGSYKWNGARKAFIPLGHGFGKIIASSAVPSTENVLAILIEWMAEQTVAPLPVPVVEWKKWYDKNMRKRDEELTVRAKR